MEEKNVRKDAGKTWKKSWKADIKWMILVLCMALLGVISWNVWGTEKYKMHEEWSCLLNVTPTIYSDDPANENMAGLFQNVARNVCVQIHMDKADGSGVIWKIEEGQVILVTAAHVLAQNSEVVHITFADGYQVHTSNYVMASEADIAFVYVALDSIPPVNLQNYYCINENKSAYDNRATEDIMIVMGSVQSPGDRAYEGKLVEPWIWVEDFKQYMMIAKIVAEPGMSGGGVFSEEGYFLGIMCGVNEDDEVAILPWALMEAIYEGL